MIGSFRISGLLVGSYVRLAFAPLPRPLCPVFRSFLFPSWSCVSVWLVINILLFILLLYHLSLMHQFGLISALGTVARPGSSGLFSAW